ncbi:MAG: hypothetical protein ACI86S_001980 [Paracoccaceae bacterium]|jgi:hypothetical protein
MNAFAKHLNLLRGAPDFALFAKADGSFAVRNPDRITPDMGVVWLAVKVTLANGTQVPAVMSFDAAIGDNPQAAYFWVADRWFEPASLDDRAEMAATGLKEADIFPYAWATHIPMDV